MISRRFRGEEGQVHLLLLSACVGALFVGLAFFQVGRAEDLRGSAQTAADAAALAAARAARDGVLDALEQAVEGAVGTGDWRPVRDLLLDPRAGDVAAGAAARRFAERNGATLEHIEGRGNLGYYVEVETKQDLRGSTIEGTENARGTATAQAEVEDLGCSFDPETSPSPSPAPSPAPPPLVGIIRCGVLDINVPPRPGKPLIDADELDELLRVHLVPID